MHRNRETKPRGLGRLVGSLALGLAVALSFGGSAVADQASNGTEEALPPSKPPTASVANFGTTVRGGAPVAVVVSGGLGGKLNIIDLNTGQPVIEAKAIANEETDVQAWGFATLKDNSVLIGAAQGGLYRYNPEGDTVEQLSNESVAGYKQVSRPGDFLWDIAVDENDTAYIATTPRVGGGRVLTWNKSNGWGALADPVEDEKQQQARSIAYEDGKVYVGIGTINPKIYQIDTKTRVKKPLSLPSEVCNDRTSKLLPHIEAKAGKLYVEDCSEEGTAVIDIASGESNLLPDTKGKVISRPGEAKKVYYVTKGQLMEYDPDANKSAPLLSENNLLGRLSPNSWVTHDLFVSSKMSQGDLTIYNPAAADGVTFREVKGEINPNDNKYNVVPAARAIQSMTAADNGKLFASWYMSVNKLLSITPGETAAATGFTLLDSVEGQGEGMATNGDTLVVGLYPGAKVDSRSTSDDSSYEAEPTAVDGQDRPYAITHTEGNVFAIGTVPKDGHLGGALAFYDAGGRALKNVYKFDSLKYANGVPQDRLAKQSPISMAYRDGKLYIGTTVRGGHSVAAGGEAQLVEFDVASGTVTRIINPFEGEGQKAITALTFGDDGQLYGLTGNYVFTVDTKSFGITKKTSVIGGDNKGDVATAGAAVNRSWLVQHNGMLYGVLGGNLYAIQASDLAAVGGKPIAESVAALTLGKDSYLYYARGATIYRNDYAKTKR